ncbi:hypothetical protein [Paenibacillus sp. FSL H3-0286]|uniref:hypothetical protein n=1 Tax=Paenibacillus sp. FSL H3-0286 TaxID=2921427 RepID=UPI00325121C9
MNTWLKELVKTKQPKISTLSDEETKAYKTGLQMLAISVCEGFFDIPPVSNDRFGDTGLFYEISYYSSDQLWTSDNQRTLLVVWETVKNKSSYCPLRIDFKFVLTEDSVDYWLYVYDQSGEKTVKWELAAKEGNNHYTTIHEYETIKLSELIGYKEVN